MDEVVDNIKSNRLLGTKGTQVVQMWLVTWSSGSAWLGCFVSLIWVLRVQASQPDSSDTAH
jgi:hypothetical protein